MCSACGVVPRGDSSRYERALEAMRVPRTGAGRPRVRPDRMRAHKAYTSHENRVCCAVAGPACTLPDKADQARNRQRLGSRSG
ncbi:hypothetical protein GCM10023324_42360 [Streptomyces youssoufiensis]